MTAPLNILVFSTNSDRATPVVEILQRQGHSILGVWGKETDLVSEVEQAKPDLIVVAGFTALFPSRVLEIPKFGAINLHAGKLPHYRGGSPLNWQIINGEKEIGISVLRMTEELDAGPVLAEASFSLLDEDDISSVHQKANRLFPELVATAVRAIVQGDSKDAPQNREKAVYWHQRRKEDGKIDFARMDSKSVHNLVRGITRPYPGAFALCGDAVVTIFKTAEVVMTVRGVPGRILYLQGEGPFVVCEDRALKIVEYETSNQKRLTHGDYLR